MPKAEKDRYLELLGKSLENRNPHQIELDAELEKLSLIVLDSKAKGEKFKDKSEFKEQVKKIRQLDIVKAAEALKNPVDADEHGLYPPVWPHAYQETEVTPMKSLSSGEATIHKVGYDAPITMVTFAQGVKLGHGAYVSYPWFELGGVVINGLEWSTTSNANEEYRQASHLASENGDFELVSEVCLNDKGTMTSVDFEQTSNSYVTSSIGTIQFSDYDVEDNTFYWYNSVGFCHRNADTTNLIATNGSTGYQLSGLQDVSVS